MPLPNAAHEFFERLYAERFWPIREAHDAECRKLEWTANHVERFGLFERELLQFTRKLIDVRVQALIETFQRINQFPDEADLGDCAKDLALMANTAINGFPAGFFKGPLCSMPLNLVNRRLETLTERLRQLPTAPMAPLQRLAAEGKMIASQTDTHTSLAAMNEDYISSISSDDVDVLELKPNFFGLGINLNYLIKKLVRRFKRKS